MAYIYNLPNSTDGIDTIMTDTASALPALIPLLLLFTFFVIFLGGIARQKARTGNTDASLWAVVASIGTLMVTLLLSLKEGFINLLYLVIVITVTIFSGVWFFISQKQSEV